MLTDTTSRRRHLLPPARLFHLRDAAAQEALLAKANAEAEAGEAAKYPRKFGYRSAYPYYDQVLARLS